MDDELAPTWMPPRSGRGRAGGAAPSSIRAAPVASSLMDDELAPTWMPSRRTRAYIYRVLTATMPLAQVYGIVNGNTAALWVGFAGTVLGVGMASANTTTA